MANQTDYNVAEVDVSKFDKNPLVEDTFDDEKESYGFNLSSGIFFLVASVLYVWVSVVGLDYQYEIQDIPDDVLQADDLLSWAPYIEDGSYEDDYVFNVGPAWVSSYQMIYFAAATCFLVTGILDCFRQPGFLGACFTLAGLFGMASAIFLEYDEYISNVLNSVSVHLFMVEAFYLLYRHDYTGWIKYYILMGDLFWVGGTVTDVVISYYGIWGIYDLRHSKVEIFAASLWLACSIIFVLSSIIYLKERKGGNTYDEEEEEGGDGGFNVYDEEEEVDHEAKARISGMPDGNLGRDTRDSKLQKRKSRKKNREQFKGKIFSV
jgi:hypothetical protein